MALYVYNRCSTDSQDYAQQQNCINKHLTAHNINPETDIAKTVVEKVSGTINHTERRLAWLLSQCKQGDTIFISELSRLGRNMSDLFAIVTECCKRGITIVQCKDDSKIENSSIQGKALLFALSLAAEIEVANTRQRTQMALDARKKILADGGSFISKSGKECYKLGRPRITPEERKAGITGDNSAAIQAKTDAAIAWRENSAAYKWVMEKVAENWPRKVIIEEFNKLHELQPTIFCTREGKPLSKGVLSKWARSTNQLALVV